jgi:DNA-binding CsgD family transcriptional regulator
LGRCLAKERLAQLASRLRAADTEGQIAVIFEEARPSEIAPLIVDAYGLTKREGEITRLVLRGLSTAEVSEELHITPNTVRDHFKAIFDKVGVRSRRELVGQVFTQQYELRMATGYKLDADGWARRLWGAPSWWSTDGGADPRC